MQSSPLALPKVDRKQLDVRPIDWSGLTRRYMNDGELEVLIALVRSVQVPDWRCVVEFGVNEGRTAKAILDNVEDVARYVGIDVLPGYTTAKAVQRREVPAKAGHMVGANDRRFRLSVTPRGSFDLTAAALSELASGPVDVAFIDGDHGWKGVLHDTLLARQVVRPGGIIIWHDYHGLDTVDVREVLETFSANGSNIQYVAGTWLAFERVT